MKLPNDRCYRVKRMIVLAGDVPDWLTPGECYWGHPANSRKRPPWIALENPDGDGEMFVVSGNHVELVEDGCCEQSGD